MVSLGRHDGIDVQMEMASSDVHCVSALNSPGNNAKLLAYIFYVVYSMTEIFVLVQHNDLTKCCIITFA